MPSHAKHLLSFRNTLHVEIEIKNLNLKATLLCARRCGNAFPSQKKVWERCSHAFPPHYTPGGSPCYAYQQNVDTMKPLHHLFNRILFAITRRVCVESISKIWKWRTIVLQWIFLYFHRLYPLACFFYLRSCFLSTYIFTRFVHKTITAVINTISEA